MKQCPDCGAKHEDTAALCKVSLNGHPARQNRRGPAPGAGPLLKTKKKDTT